MIIVDGHKSTPFGKVFNVSIKITGATIRINIIIVNTISYKVVLRNKFLKKVKATIDFNSEQMHIYYRGKRFKIPIDIQKGVHPSMIQEVDKDDEETFFVNWKDQN